MSIFVLLMLLPASTLAGPTHGGAAAAKCSRAAARSAVIRHHLGNAGSVPDPVGQVVCGAFMGAGSRVMVASLTTPGCGGTIGWVVFRLRSGSWRIVMQRDNGAQLTAVDTSIRETQQVLRPGDAHCFPTGGTRSRSWHWNGSRFVTTSWRSSLSTSNPTEFHARLTTVTIGCGIASPQQMACQGIPTTPGGSRPRLQVARLLPDGQVASCAERGPGDDCRFGDLGERVPDLSPGTQTTVGPFTCKVSDTGVQCTVTATRKGFLITASDIAVVGG